MLVGCTVAKNEEPGTKPAEVLKDDEQSAPVATKDIVEGTLKPTLIYDQAIPSQLTYTLKNQTAKTIELNFNDGMLYDFTLTNEKTGSVFTYSEDIMTTMALQQKVLKPAEEISFTLHLPQPDESGVFTLSAWLNTQDEVYNTSSKSEIKFEKKN
jgi:hypothetical protein